MPAAVPPPERTSPRPDGLTYAETVRALHDEGVIVMADCGSFADAERAVEAGTDIISTTLSGYTGERPKTDGPDFELLGQMIEAFPDVPVLCEGRIHTPDQLHQVMAAGAWAAVVGTAITHPTHAQLHCSGRSESSPCRPAARRVRRGDCLVRLHRLSQS